MTQADAKPAPLHHPPRKGVVVELVVLVVEREMKDRAGGAGLDLGVITRW